MTREDYCSFEISKILKEKGFDWMCKGYYNKDDEDKEPYFGDGEGADNWNNQAPSVRDLWFSAPTHQMAMKWLREKHKIYAAPIQQGNYDDNSIYYTYSVAQIIDGRSYIHRPMSVVDKFTYEEAVEAALKYSLENLI